MPFPGIVGSTPIFRKSPPALNVPTNIEKVPLALIDFQLRSVGLIAPSVVPQQVVVRVGKPVRLVLIRVPK